MFVVLEHGKGQGCLEGIPSGFFHEFQSQITQLTSDKTLMTLNKDLNLLSTYLAQS